MIKTTVGIDGMMCGMCESHVNDAIRKSFDVKKVSVYELFRKTDQRRRTNCDRIAGKGICHGHCGKRFFTD